jgi:putative ATPase
MILWGPPGCGKTSIAKLLGKDRAFKMVNQPNIADVKSALQSFKFSKQKGILFVDEIHRFTKSQQDVFLDVEKGEYILIGATTENPSFRLNNALLSRCKVYPLDKLNDSEILQVLRNASIKTESAPFDEKYLTRIVPICNGDARIALNHLKHLLDWIKTRGDIDEDGLRIILQRNHFTYDQSGEEHYNLISAFHKVQF